MRFDLRLVAMGALSLTGCPDEKPAPPTSRFESVSSKSLSDERRLCDKTWPGGAKPFTMPPLRSVEGVPAAEPGKGWRWVNLWATWCAPCIEEMALLNRWKSALDKEGVAVSFEMVSVDDSEAQPALKTWLGRLPGPLTWVHSPDEVPAWLEKSIGLSPDSAIPIHLLVDPSGSLRCARVGAVHPQDYGSVRTFLSAP